MKRMLVSCAAVLVLAGCAASDDSAKPTLTATPKSTPAPTATRPPIGPASAEDLQQGRDYRVVARLPAQIDGSPTRWLAADAKGASVGVVAVAKPGSDKGTMGDSGSWAQPILRDTSGTITRLAPARTTGPGVQVSLADVNDDWVTWLESSSTQIAAGEWTLYSYERATKKLRVLGSDKDDVVRAGTFLDYEGRPEISGDDVLVGTSSPVKNRRGGAVLSAPLDGSAPLEALIPGASDPDADEGGFSYVLGQRALMYRDAATGTSRQITAGGDRCQFYRSRVLLTCQKTNAGTEVHVAGEDGDLTFGPFPRGVSYVQLKGGWARFVSDADGDPHIYAVDTSRSTLFEASDSQIGWTLMGNGYALVVEQDEKEAVTGYELIKLG